jgi:hypothetical protein
MTNLNSDMSTDEIAAILEREHIDTKPKTNFLQKVQPYTQNEFNQMDEKEKVVALRFNKRWMKYEAHLMSCLYKYSKEEQVEQVQVEQVKPEHIVKLEDDDKLKRRCKHIK